MNTEKMISIIGGAGHVGLPLGLAFANKNFNVNLIDLNIEYLKKIKSGQMPFYEAGGNKILLKCLKKNKILFSNNLKTINKSKFIIVCVGTPIDSNFKPQVTKFFHFFSSLMKYVKKNQIIIIRQ